MPRLYAEGDRYSQIADDPGDHLLQSVTLIRGLNAVRHLSEDNATYVVEMAGQFQLHQHAVDLKGLGSNILQKQNCAFGLDLVGRAERSDQDGKASAIENALGFAFDQSVDIRPQRHVPWRLARDRGLPRWNVNAAFVGPVFRRHWAVEGSQSCDIMKVGEQ